MTIADTNILVGLVTQMTASQRAVVDGMLLEAQQTEQPVTITEGVFVETEWVLRRRFKFSRRDVARVLHGLLDTAAFEAWDPPVAALALRLMEHEPRLDAVDCVLAARHVLGDAPVVTFDRLLARTIHEYRDPCSWPRTADNPKGPTQ